MNKISQTRVSQNNMYKNITISTESYRYINTSDDIIN